MSSTFSISDKTFLREQIIIKPTKINEISFDHNLMSQSTPKI